MNNNNKDNERSTLRAALSGAKRYFLYAGLFSAAVNVLMLVPILYMLQIYDRVIVSGSMPTLLMLTLLMVFLLLALGIFEWVRSMILVAASNRIERSLRGRVSAAAFRNTLLGGSAGPGAQAMNDLTSLRQFLTGNGLFAFFDAPWVPIYVAVMFLFHLYFGLAAVVAVGVMLSLAFITEKSTNRKLADANSLMASATAQFNGSLRNAEVVAAMGMEEGVRQRQDASYDEVISLQSNASRGAARWSSVTKTFRLIVQSLVLGLGAWLALQQAITPGMMIAGSLLLGRALAPIDLLVGTWKHFSVARAQYSRLDKLLDTVGPEAEAMTLPAPEGRLQVEQAIVVPPGAKVPAVRGVSLELRPGEALGIVGPSAAGKSSLARAILGIWPCYSGKIRLDGADIATWPRSEIGPYVGYLPQDIELFDGSISENICRFGDLNSERIVEAAKLAGVHEMVLRMPEGYNTRIGGIGGVLSSGQRQRIGLARAVYGRPRLLVLDEPNSNLDHEGEIQLAEAINRIKTGPCTIVVITHRTMVLQCVDTILVMKEGTAASYGPKEQVLGKLVSPAQADASG